MHIIYHYLFIDFLSIYSSKLIMEHKISFFLKKNNTSIFLLSIMLNVNIYKFNVFIIYKYILKYL